MEKQYVLHGHEVGVIIQSGLVRIANDKSLKHVFALDPIASAPRLVCLIKEDYTALFGKALTVGDDSFVIEIWVHVYFEYFLLRYKKILKAILWFGLYRRFCRSCEVIDCGERGKDPNRWLWDRLAPYRNKIAKWMPDYPGNIPSG